MADTISNEQLVFLVGAKEAELYMLRLRVAMLEQYQSQQAAAAATPVPPTPPADRNPNESAAGPTS